MCTSLLERQTSIRWTKPYNTGNIYLETLRTTNISTQEFQDFVMPTVLGSGEATKTAAPATNKHTTKVEWVGCQEKIIIEQGIPILQQK